MVSALWIIWIVNPFERNRTSPLNHCGYSDIIFHWRCIFNPCQVILFPPETNITDYFMADFEQRGELPALVCGASGKEITFAGKFQPKKAGSKLLCLRISYLQEWSLWAASLGRAYSTWGWTPETKWPCLPPIVQRWLHFAYKLRHWILQMYYVFNNFVKNLSTWPIIILFKHFPVRPSSLWKLWRRSHSRTNLPTLHCRGSGKGERNNFKVRSWPEDGLL